MSGKISIREAHQNNLKNLSLDLNLNKITVVTGVSGSGKSSLAFDTVYAEGQRRYIESFSAYARQFMERMDKPTVKSIDGILPSIAINQTNPIKTSRSTLGTLTEINDYMKLLFPRIAVLYCRSCGVPVEKDSSGSIAQKLMQSFESSACVITFPLRIADKDVISTRDIESGLRRQGFFRAYHSGTVTEISADLIESSRSAQIDILVDRLFLAAADKKRLVDSLETAVRFGKGFINVFTDGAVDPLKFSTALHCPRCEIMYRAPCANLFSFNSPLGACSHCNGFGKTIEVDMNAVIPDTSLSLKDNAVKPWSTPSYREAYYDMLSFCKKRSIPVGIPFCELAPEQRDAVIDGDDDFYGIKGFFSWLETKTYKMHIRVLLSKYRAYETCRRCGGTRFKDDALLYRVGGRTIAETYAMSTADCLTFFRDLRTGASHDKTVAVLLDEITGRLGYLVKVGLGYLTLDRQSRTLSGGEIERASLTTALGSSLVNTLYVLDEPSIGLHPRDTHLLIDILKGLRDIGNTIMIVEHDPDIIMQSDTVVDLGPESGERGGEIMCVGSPRDLLENPASLTGRYLAGELAIPSPETRRQPDRRARIRIRNADKHNLKKISLTIPTRQLVCITGVSGSGKSTLLEDILYRHLSKKDARSPVCSFEGSQPPEHVVLMDQSPVGKTPRSNPVTYIKVFDAIRTLFSQTDTARGRSYTPSTFSFNSPGGRCEQCRGDGFEKVEMQFLADVFVTCSACRGSRYAPEVLDVRYQGKSIHQVLQMTVSEAVRFFSDIPRVEYPLRLLEMVGLGYLRLGQPANTLSGGESQRLKMSSFILQGSSGKTLFLFDEPTTGLHFEDIQKLLQTFSFLISHGHSIIVVEHNLEVIKCADHVIDLGPEGGEGGGGIVFAGTPDELVARQESHTGRFLSRYLEVRHGRCAPPGPAPSPEHAEPCITIECAREHNLQNISLALPREKMVVITGPSGSGKSTLAFDIIYAEGQRRFLETLSPYARQYVHQLSRPEVDAIRGLPPTVAIEQLLSRGGKKSTVATVTEIYHYLRLLFAKVGRQHCPSCGRPMVSQSPAAIARHIARTFSGGRIMILAPQVRSRKGFHKDIIQRARKEGLNKIRIDGKIVRVNEIFAVQRYHEHQMELVTAELRLSETLKARLAAEVNRALALGSGELIVIDSDGGEIFYSTRSACPSCRISMEEPDPRLFSFNSRHGACSDCGGLGIKRSISPDLLIADKKRSIEKGGIAPLISSAAAPSIRKKWIRHIAEKLRIPTDIPLAGLSKPQMRRLFEGTKKAPGLIELLEAPGLMRKAGWADSLEQFYVAEACHSCGGSRLCPQARSVKVLDKSIADLAGMLPGELLSFLSSLSFEGRDHAIAQPILQELTPKLELLQKAGLSYLRLDRSADTLSGGELQRIRLAAQVASNLRGVAYVLDEPTVGLHPHDNHSLLSIIRDLQQRGNSVIIVEHDEETIRSADYIIDLGPGGGTGGGQVVAAGTLRDILQCSASVTGACLAGTNSRKPFISARPLKGCSHVTVSGATEHNLKNITAAFPVGRLTAVTGVSGAGKTTLVRDVLYKGLKKSLGQYHGPAGRHEKLIGRKNIKRVVEIDQSPIGKTPRSIPATYVGFYDTIRQLFSQVPDSRMRGYAQSRFSFNTGGGRCEKCSGQGKIKVAMSFLPDMYIDCDVCRGTRFNEETLHILYRDKSIAQVLAMTVDEACAFFSDVEPIAKPLRILQKMGIGYLTLGQPSPTLSGGEAQRIKIAAELCKSNQDKTLYVLDEPTTGLHSADIVKLMEVVQALVDLGSTVVIIEHNLEVIEQADFIIDLGPFGGDGGGSVVASGPPAKVAFGGYSDSLTAAFLKKHLERNGFHVA